MVVVYIAEGFVAVKDFIALLDSWKARWVIRSDLKLLDFVSILFPFFTSSAVGSSAPIDMTVIFQSIDFDDFVYLLARLVASDAWVFDGQPKEIVTIVEETAPVSEELEADARPRSPVPAKPLHEVLQTKLLTFFLLFGF